VDASKSDVHHLHVWLTNLKNQSATHPALAERCELMMERLVMKMQDHQEVNGLLHALRRAVDQIDSPSEFIAFAHAVLNTLDTIDSIN
jgi:hypothetical protein